MSGPLVDKIPSVSSQKLVGRTPRSPRLSAGVELEELPGAQVLDAIIDESALEDVALKDSDVKGLVARGVDLNRFVIAGVDLTGATLDGLGLRDGELSGSDLANVSSKRCSLERVQIENSRLTWAIFAEPRIVDVCFLDCAMNLTGFRFGRLSRVRFETCRLVESDFQAATVTACTFIDCDLSGSELSHARFAGSALRGCRLDGVSGSKRYAAPRSPEAICSSWQTCSPPRSACNSATRSPSHPGKPPLDSRKPDAARGSRRISAPV